MDTTTTPHDQRDLPAHVSGRLPYIPIYRLCKGCHTEWNVSIKEKGEGKHYYCPYCRAKISRGERLRKK